MIGRGYQVICGAAKQTLYLPSSAAGDQAIAVTDKIPVTDINFTDEFAQSPSVALTGKAGLRVQDLGPLSVSGSLAAELSYDKLKTGPTFLGTDLLIAAGMGITLWVAASSSNQITLRETLDQFTSEGAATGKGCITVAYCVRAEDAGVVEVVSAMCKSFEISGDSGDPPVKLSSEWFARNLMRSGQVNDYDDNLLTVAASEILKRVLFGDLKFRLASDFANALAAETDEIPISSFSLKYDNKLSDSQFATQGTGTAEDANRSIQPARSDFREVTLEITLPRHTANTYFAGAAAGTPFQADLVFTSGSDKFIIYLPYMVIEKPEVSVSGADVLPETISFRCLRGTDYNAGAGNLYMKMLDTSTLITEEFAIETKNERTAGILV